MPSSPQWEKIEALFDEVLAWPRGERRQWLARACPDDDELRREVEAMVAALERDYARRALEVADRLSGPERATVEGRYYLQSVETYDRAVDVYRQALEQYPHLDSLRSDLVDTLTALERFDEAIEHLELLRNRRTIGVQGYLQLANAYARRGETAQSHRILEESQRRFPEDAWSYHSLAWLLVEEGRLDEAEAALRQAEALRPGYSWSHDAAWGLHLLRGEWQELEAIGERIGRLAQPWARERYLSLRALHALHRGNSSGTAELFEQAAATYPTAGRARAHARAMVASWLLRLGARAALSRKLMSGGLTVLEP